MTHGRASTRRSHGLSLIHIFAEVVEQALDERPLSAARDDIDAQSARRKPAHQYPSLPDFILSIDALPLSPFSLKDNATLVITFGFEARVIVVVTPPTIEKLSCVKPIEVISPSAFVFTYSVTTCLLYTSL